MGIWPTIRPKTFHTVFFLFLFSADFFDIIGFLRPHCPWVHLVRSLAWITFKKAPRRCLTSSYAEQSRKTVGATISSFHINIIYLSKIKSGMFGSTAGRLNINCAEICVPKMSGAFCTPTKRPTRHQKLLIHMCHDGSPGFHLLTVGMKNELFKTITAEPEWHQENPPNKDFFI